MTALESLKYHYDNQTLVGDPDRENSIMESILELSEKLDALSSKIDQLSYNGDQK